MQNIDVQGNNATAVVTDESGTVQHFSLARKNDGWKIDNDSGG